MRTLVLLAVLYIGVLLQSFCPGIAVLGYSPVPVIPGLVVYYGLTAERAESMRAAFLAGFLQDALGSVPLGVSSVVYCAIAWCLNRYREEVFISDWFTHVVFGALANFVAVGVTGIFLRRAGFLPAGAGAMGIKLFAGLALGGLLIPLIFVVVNGLYKRLGLGDLECSA